MRALLTQIAKTGIACEAATASIFDPPRQVVLDDVVSRHRLSISTKSEALESISFVGVADGDITHTILKTASSRRNALSAGEESALLSLIERKIGEFKPEIILTYGGLNVERNIHRLAKASNIPVVFYLANGLYRKAETFASVDMILVPSRFLADFYADRLGLRANVLRDTFIKDNYLAIRENPRYITYVNPVPQKGLTLFSRIASEALRRLPGAEFLVVEGRWTKEDVARAGLKLDRIPNIKVIPNRTDMREVYARTKILLFPSLWNEASGRMPVEAQLNGIPVLASRVGGIAENLNGGGFLFDIPERCAANHMAVPTPEEVGPWIERIGALLEDDNAYEEAERRALLAAEAFDPERIAGTALDLFKELPKR